MRQGVPRDQPPGQVQVGAGVWIGGPEGTRLHFLLTEKMKEFPASRRQGPVLVGAGVWIGAPEGTRLHFLPGGRK